MSAAVRLRTFCFTEERSVRGLFIRYGTGVLTTRRDGGLCAQKITVFSIK